MNNKVFLSVIIPAYNEENRIGKTVESVIAYLDKQNYSWEILLVDDGSKDNTVNLVKKIDPRIIVISHNANMGKGAAVKTGMLRAGGEWGLLMDADNSTPISEIEKLWPKAQGNVIVIGSRYKDRSSIQVEQPKYRVLLGRIGNWVIQKLIVKGIVDTQCGFKLFSRGAIDDLFPRQTINRWGFDFELLGMAQRLGWPVEEVPVNWYDSIGSRMRPIWAYPKTFMELIKIKWRFMRGKHKEHNGSGRIN